MFRGRRLTVEVTKEATTYTLVDGEPLEISHHGEALTVSQEQPVMRDNPSAPARPAPSQPPGREPARRGIEAPLVTDI
jgi:alpha,alpha-trehalose phosphorylase